jgi:hypothetical protein
MVRVSFGPPVQFPREAEATSVSKHLEQLFQTLS